MDGRAWDPQFEPNLGLHPRCVVSRVRKTQAERQRRTVSLRQGRRAQPTKDAQAVLDSAQLRESTTSAMFPMSPRLVSSR